MQMWGAHGIYEPFHKMWEDCSVWQISQKCNSLGFLHYVLVGWDWFLVFSAVEPEFHHVAGNLPAADEGSSSQQVLMLS